MSESDDDDDDDSNLPQKAPRGAALLAKTKESRKSTKKRAKARRRQVAYEKRQEAGRLKGRVDRLTILAEVAATKAKKAAEQSILAKVTAQQADERVTKSTDDGNEGKPPPRRFNVGSN